MSHIKFVNYPDRHPLRQIAQQINKTSMEHGFWPEGVERNFGEMIALAHSELSEALEEHCAGRPVYWEQHDLRCAQYLTNKFTKGNADAKCTCNPKPEGSAVEMIDCIIRLLDTLYSMDVDIDKVVLKKMIFNDSREYKHGKAY